MPTTYDDVSGEPQKPFKTKAQRALDGDDMGTGSQKMPLTKDPDGMPVYRMPDFEGEEDKASRKMGTGEPSIEALKQLAENDKRVARLKQLAELTDDEDDEVEVPSDIEERLESIRKSVEDLLRTHPRAMALKMAIEALPGAAPEEQLKRAADYVRFIQNE